VLVREVMAGVLGMPADVIPIVRTCETCGRPHGRPRLVNHDGWHLSVSHSGDRVGLAVARRTPVGLDVERVVPALTGDVVDALMTTAEQHAVSHLHGRRLAVAVLQVWVRKEAVVKATSQGLRIDLTSFSVGSPLGPAQLSGEVPGATTGAIELLDLDPGGPYVASIALLGPLCEVREVHVGQWPPAR
jgi:4'-phosphopantetheinyl transferase